MGGPKQHKHDEQILIGMILLNLISPNNPNFPEEFKKIPIFSKFKTSSNNGEDKTPRGDN